MVARAYVLGIGPGGATPPVAPSGWSELWDEADYLALIAKYTASGFQFFADPAVFPAAAAVFFVSGGTFQMVADGNPWAALFGPPPFSPPVREYWMRFQFSMAGGAFDNTYTNAPANIDIQDLTATLDASVNTDNGAGPHNYIIYAGPDGTFGDTGLSWLFAAGAHTIIVCASEDDATHQRLELWIDAAPGSPATAVAVTSKTAGMGYEQLTLNLSAPVAPGLTLTVQPIEMQFSNRASNAYGIL